VAEVALAASHGKQHIYVSYAINITKTVIVMELK